MEYFFDFYKGARKAPGNTKSTEQALHMLGPRIPNPAKILDIGCGSGEQTLTLVQLLQCHITAVDLNATFLHELEQVVTRCSLTNKITLLEASMDALPFAENTFDLIWSEGAIYIMGFEKGLNYWRNFLCPQGFLVLTELSWLHPKPPAAATAYWNKNYPHMQSIAQNITSIETAGYKSLGHFILPEEAWVQNYYAPLEAKKSLFLQRHQNNEQAQHVVKELEEEITMYTTHKEHYGYVFYLAQKLAYTKP